MKKKERMLALERFAVIALANGDRERRRTDEAMARIAELEAGRVDTEAALFRTGETVADLVAGIAVLRARVAELERRIGAEGQVSESDGTWWYDDGEKAAYTVTVTER